MLYIQLFGNIQIYHNANRLLSIRKRGQALLALLLLERRSLHSREDVAAQLWPETNDAQARSNLRKELMYLRHALPDYQQFLFDSDGYLGWCKDASLSADMIDFECALHNAKMASDSEDETNKRITLEKAVALYRGDLLLNLDFEWLVLPRQRMAAHFMASLEQLSELHRKQGDYQQALFYARKLMHYDPLHEPVYRHLMEIYAQNGDHANVQRVYQSCVSLFHREFAALPSPVTQGLYQSILG